MRVGSMRQPPKLYFWELLTSTVAVLDFHQTILAFVLRYNKSLSRIVIFEESFTDKSP